MKSIFGCFILSNGSSLITKRPCLKSFLTRGLLVIDSVNHPIWSSRVGESKTEVSKFINKFNVKNNR